MASSIDPKKIRIDCDTQARLEMNEEVIAEYAAAMERGDEFPAIQVFFAEERDEFILADGFFRYFAHMRVRPNDPILAEVRLGNVQDAQWASFAANKTHGWPRSNADKRSAAQRALLHPTGVKSSNRHIAKHVGVAESTVRLIRDELVATAQIAQSDFRQGQDGRVINTSQIGKKTEGSASCNQCLNFMESNGECAVNGSKQRPWSEACEKFEEIPEEPERRELENIPDLPEEYEEVELKKGPKKKNPCRYKSRNTVCIDVPLGNPQLAAAELRARLGEEYLEQCTIASLTLLRTSHDDDPFPNL